MEKCESQVGSGSLPADRLPSFALAIRPSIVRRKALVRVDALSRVFRTLSVPVVGRVNDGVFYLDLRCLDDEKRFLIQLEHLDLDARHKPT